MFDLLYKAKNDEMSVFGNKWCGPSSFPENGQCLIATYSKVPDGDGHEVEIYCTASPARFYEVRALDSKNSMGEVQKGFSLSTGSGIEMAKLAALMAEQIANGMLGQTSKK